MAFDETLAARVRALLRAMPEARDLVEKKMFGGLCFMVRGHMCCGVEKANLMMRVGPAQYAGALGRPGAREMDFTGKPLKGFVYVEPAHVAEDVALREWLGLCLDFNGTMAPKDGPPKTKPGT